MSLEYARIYKGVKPCPCCGGRSYFGVAGCMDYEIRCEDCGLSGKSVSLPSYSTKYGDKVIGRLFMRALKPWNRRV